MGFWRQIGLSAHTGDPHERLRGQEVEAQRPKRFGTRLRLHVQLWLTLGISGGARRRPLDAVVSPRFGRSRRRWRPSLAFQSISPGYYLEFAADGFLDCNDGSRLEYESRKHRTKLVNGHRIVALYQHMATPLADSYHEEFDREIGGRLPLTEYLKDSLLGILVLDGRTLGAFEPADHVLHWHPPNCVGPRNDCCLDGLTTWR